MTGSTVSPGPQMALSFTGFGAVLSFRTNTSNCSSLSPVDCLAAKRNILRMSQSRPCSS